MAYGAAVTMAGALMPYLTKAVANPNITASIASGAVSGLPALLRGDILGAATGGLTGAATGYGIGGLTKGLFLKGWQFSWRLQDGYLSCCCWSQQLYLSSWSCSSCCSGLALGGINRGVQNLASQAVGGVTGAAGQTGQNAIGLLGYHAVTGEPLYGTAVPQGTGQYGGVPPVGGSAMDVLQAGGPAGAQRLTTLKNAQTMADALNAYLPTVRKFSEQAKKDDFERNMASAGIKQNIATNAQMLAAAQAAGLGMGLTGAQQAGQALTQQYNY
jgi:hypothetical protein